MMSDLISRQAAIDAIRASTSKYTGFMEMEMYTDDDAVEAIEGLPSAQPEIVRCEECVYRRNCMLHHFVESNAVDGAKIDWSEWYCADGVRDISKSDERLEE